MQNALMVNGNQFMGMHTRTEMSRAKCEHVGGRRMKCSYNKIKVSKISRYGFFFNRTPYRYPLFQFN